MYHRYRRGMIGIILISIWTQFMTPGSFAQTVPITEHEQHAPQAEVEPNNTIAQANPIVVGYTQGHRNATIPTASDVDVFKFTAAANATYVIETYNVAGTPGTDANGIWLRNASGTALTDDRHANNGTGTASARIVFTFVNAGIYYITVDTAEFGSWTGTYSLRVLPKYNQPGAGWDPAADYEPNDTKEIANAMTIGLGGAVTRQLADHTSFATADSDNDYYVFTATAGRTYVIEIYNVAGTSSRAVGLWLYNNTGSAITNDQYGNNGTGAVNARIIFTASASEAVFIQVKDATFEEWAGTYSLRVLPRYNEAGAAWNTQQDYEPNDVYQLSNPIAVGVGSSVVRQILDTSNLVSPNDEQDFFVFTAVAGRTYVIQTYNTGTTDRATGLWLYNTSGSAITNDQYGNQGTGTLDAEIEYTIPTSGHYFVMVRAATFENWTGTYSFRVCQTSCLQRVYVPYMRR